MLRVAVVGSGPAGLYTAEALVKQAAALPVPVRVRVDVLDRLPTPYGLVRYGVAPDHKSIKSIAEYLRGVLEHDGVHFVGGVHLGDDVTRDDLLASLVPLGPFRVVAEIGVAYGGFSSVILETFRPDQFHARHHGSMIVDESDREERVFT